MNFAEKLVFLIHLTDSTNKKLADAIHLDPSQVSRLRCGVRGLPHRAEYLPKMAAYFSGLCQSSYRQLALAEQLGSLLPGVPADQDTLTDALCRWLEGESPHVSAAEPLLRPSGNFHLLCPAEPQESAKRIPDKGKNIFVFTGEHGKKQAVDHLLELTCKRGLPTQVMLCSDESSSPALVRNYCQNILPNHIMELTRIGCSFQRIIRPDADLDYTFTSVMLWMPAFLNGKVKTFYYPCHRDAVYHRTLVVARHVGAVISVSVGTHSESCPCYLVTEPGLVEYYVKEFHTYLSMCESAAETCRGIQSREYLLETLTVPTGDRGEILQKSDGLSLISLPSELYSQFTEGKNPKAPDHFKNQLAQCDSYFNSLGNKTFTDIITMAAPEDIRGGRATYSVSCSFSTHPLYYQPEQYKLHLKNIVAMLQRYPNYRIIIADNENTFPHTLIISGACKALLIKAQEELSLIKINNPDVIAALQEYLRRTYLTDINDTDSTIKRLNELICLI